MYASSLELGCTQDKSKHNPRLEDRSIGYIHCRSHNTNSINLTLKETIT